MILSEQHQFIFIKGRKVAGTSIEASLSTLCGKNDIITPISIIDEKKRLSQGSPGAQNFGLSTLENNRYLAQVRNVPPEQLFTIKMPKGQFYNHMPLTEVLELYPLPIKDWAIFAIERCPYSKVISLANMLLKYRDYQMNGKAMISQQGELKQHIQTIIDNKSVLDVRNIDLYKNASGEVCGTILRYESVQEDFNHMMSKLGIDKPPALPHYKQGLSSNTLNPTDIFTRKQIDFINEAFEEEFLTFDYQTL